MFILLLSYSIEQFRHLVSVYTNSGLGKFRNVITIQSFSVVFGILLRQEQRFGETLPVPMSNIQTRVTTINALAAENDPTPIAAP